MKQGSLQYESAPLQGLSNNLAQHQIGIGEDDEIVQSLSQALAMLFELGVLRERLLANEQASVDVTKFID